MLGCVLCVDVYAHAYGVWLPRVCILYVVIRIRDCARVGVCLGYRY